MFEFLRLKKRAETIRYLLGETSDKDNLLIEQNMFEDDDRFAEMLAAEDELVAGYISRELTDDQRQRFEQKFLSTPEGRRRFDATRSLHETIEKEKTSLRPPMPGERNTQTRSSSFRVGRWALVASAAAMMTTIFWLCIALYRADRLAGDLAAERDELRRVVSNANAATSTDPQARDIQQQLTNEQARLSETDEQLAALHLENEQLRRSKPRNERPPVSVITFFLTAGTTRGSSGSTLKLAGSERTVILEAPVSDRSPTYQVSLQTPEGREIWARAGVKKRSNSTGDILILPVPARLLPRGDYILLVNAPVNAGQVERIAQFSFAVIGR